MNDRVQQNRREQEPDDIAANSQGNVLVGPLQLRRAITENVLDDKNRDRVDSDAHTNRRGRPLQNTRSTKTQCVVQHSCQDREPKARPVYESGRRDRADFLRLRRFKSQI